MRVRRGCNSQIRLVMLEDLVVLKWRVLQSTQTRFSQHPDVMQASTELIRQLHLNFQQSESKLPTAFMTGCSNAKSWLNAETPKWVDDTLGRILPTHFISVLKSYLHCWNQHQSTMVSSNNTTQHVFWAAIFFFAIQLNKLQFFMKRSSGIYLSGWVDRFGGGYPEFESWISLFLLDWLLCAWLF